MVINHLEKLFVTSDASTITTELEVQHPAAKLLAMAAGAQQQEIGDGTNFVSPSTPHHTHTWSPQRARPSQRCPAPALPLSGGSSPVVSPGAPASCGGPVQWRRLSVVGREAGGASRAAASPRARRLR